MTSLKDRLHEEMTASMKAGDRARLGALRMLAAAVTNREKEVLHDLSDDEVRTESLEIFEQAGRMELADKERAEREVLLAYAPAQLDEAAVDALVEEAIGTTGASGPQDFGKVMGLVMGKAKGQVDGSVVQQKVRARLGG
jgi:uncharacterized protein YqeY